MPTSRLNGNIGSKTLHIYIEGDGVPWVNRIFIAKDPTPEYALMLDAMLRDSEPSLYIGRPCYYHTDDDSCQADDWTMGRYGNKVVNSMAALVNELAQDYKKIWLIGHSGGGALAVLIGRRLERPVNVLTVAANIDHQGWTTHHGYTPLYNSLNVIDDQIRNPEMNEMHWFGDADKNVVPLWTTLLYCQQTQTNCNLSKAKHSGGWLQQWQQILGAARVYFGESK